METQVQAIPEGQHAVTPYLTVKDAEKAIEFYKKAFLAVENYRFETKDKKIGHCELQIGDSKVMLSDEFPQMDAVAPKHGPHGFSILLYVKNVDEVFDRAVDHGAIIVHPLKDQFYGDRMGTLTDPFGHYWSVASHVEDVSPEELAKRAQRQ